MVLRSRGSRRRCATEGLRIEAVPPYHAPAHRGGLGSRPVQVGLSEGERPLAMRTTFPSHGLLRSLPFVWLLAGCASSPPVREEVRRVWHTALQELGVQPIYPPREDVQVGDIYLRRAPEGPLAEAGRYLPLDLWLAQVDLRQVAADFYAKRSHFPDSSATSEASYPREGDAFLSGDKSRLRQVAFPEFTSMTVRGKDLEWLIPVEALAIAGGSSWEGSREITLRIPSVESYGLPAEIVLDHVTVERDGRLALGPDVGLTSAQLRALRERSDLGQGELQLEVIREVYFARAVDISISRTAPSGSSSEISVIEPGTFDKEATPDPDLVERLNTRLERTLERSTPGASVRVIGANDASVVLRRTFQRPIAIGFRSFVLSIDPATGIVASICQAPETPPRSSDLHELSALESSLSQELTSWFKNDVERVSASLEDDNWILRVKPKADARGETGYLFLTRADREEIVQALHKRVGRLDEDSEDHLEAFLEGKFRFDEQ